MQQTEKQKIGTRQIITASTRKFFDKKITEQRETIPEIFTRRVTRQQLANHVGVSVQTLSREIELMKIDLPKYKSIKASVANLIAWHLG